MPDVSQVSDFSAPISALIGAVLLFVAGFAWKRANAWFVEVITDVKATKVQTTNSHNTNLRDDLTEAVEAINTVATTMDEMKTNLERMGESQRAMHEDLRETRKDVRFATEYTRDVDKRVIRMETQRKEENDGISD